MRLLTLTIFLLFTQQVLAQFGAPLSAVQLKIQDAMNSDIRTADERARDANRQPVQVLDFFSLEEDMTVIELLPAGGWYTKILAPVLKEQGKLYISQPDFFYSDAANAMLSLPEMEAVERLPWGETEQQGFGIPGSGDWGVRNVDMVLTFRNYHNFSEQARAAVNRSAFQALKPGGIYGVIDHTRRHMEADNAENGRRVDPILAIKEIQAEGFILVDYDSVLARPDDELRYEVGRRSVTGNTDRFTLMFKKPE